MPTPMSFTAAYKEAVMYADGGVIHYDCLTITSSDTTDEIAIVDSYEPLLTAQGTYLACPFELKPPETEGSVVGKLEVSVKFLPKAARIWLQEQSTNGATMSIIWRQYLGEGATVQPDFECRVPFYVTKVDIIAGGVAALTATLPDLINTPLCKKLMTKDILPGMAI